MLLDIPDGFGLFDQPGDQSFQQRSKFRYEFQHFQVSQTHPIGDTYSTLVLRGVERA